MCGKPVWLCRSQSSDLDWEVRSDVCYATRALKKYEDSKKPAKERTKNSKERGEWGKFRYAVPRLHALAAQNGKELPSRREYYDSLN